MHESYLLSAIVGLVQPSGPHRDHDMSDLSELGFHWMGETKMRIFKSRLWHVHFSERINAFDQIRSMDLYCTPLGYIVKWDEAYRY
jgi:hypothetical protein